MYSHWQCYSFVRQLKICLFYYFESSCLLWLLGWLLSLGDHTGGEKRFSVFEIELRKRDRFIDFSEPSRLLSEANGQCRALGSGSNSLSKLTLQCYEHGFPPADTWPFFFRISKSTGNEALYFTGRTDWFHSDDSMKQNPSYDIHRLLKYPNVYCLLQKNPPLS